MVGMHKYYAKRGMCECADYKMCGLGNILNSHIHKSAHFFFRHDFFLGYFMSLSKYREKRSFTKTPEPTGGKSVHKKLQFVIQKHAASHLHYDFRLEVRGVLKSWAVPKGPSIDPSVKRLAMLVEDHPFDYKDFEGIIPEGNYGAGTVIIWDEGSYEPIEEAGDKKEQEKIMLKQFHSGSIKIRMYGKKMKGEFALVRTKQSEKSWLLIKHKDEYAGSTDITKKNKSVVSGKTIETMSKNTKAKQWESNRKKSKSTRSTKNEKTSKLVSKNDEDDTTDITSLIKKGVKKSMPVKVNPMLCTLTKTPPDDVGYIYEIKWDGYRIIAFVDGKKVRLHSRSGLDYTARYPVIVQALQGLGHKMVIDGEMVVFNEDGIPDFDAVQNYDGRTTPLSYCVFDLLWIDGYDLKSLPLTERKKILETIIGDGETLKFSFSFDDGPALYAQMMKMNLEGIVAKKKESEYREGTRDYDWLKTPTRKRQEFVIGGWAESDKKRSFKSLLFGAYNKKKFEWIGRSGGGYKEKEMPAILKKLERIEIDESPFVNKVLDTKGAKTHWVKPQLVANFEFATWTKGGRIRKPATFLGFRTDKKAAQVVREVPASIAEIEEETPKRSGRNKN